MVAVVLPIRTTHRITTMVGTTVVVVFLLLFLLTTTLRLDPPRPLMGQRLRSVAFHPRTTLEVRRCHLTLRAVL